MSKRVGMDGILQNPFKVCFECKHFKKFIEQIQDLIDYCVSNELTLDEAYDLLLQKVSIDNVIKPLREECAYDCKNVGFGRNRGVYKGDAIIFLLLATMLLTRKKEKEEEKRSKMTYGRKPKAYERYGTTIQNLYQYEVDEEETEETKKPGETTEKKKKRLHTIQEISDITGLSTATVQKIIHQLKAEGKIE